MFGATHYAAIHRLARPPEIDATRLLTGLGAAAASLAIFAFILWAPSQMRG